MNKKAKEYEEWLEEFLEEKRGQGLSSKSLKSEEFSVNKYLKFLGNGVISKTSYYEYINSLEVSPVSKQHYARDLRCFLYWCQREEYLPEFKVSLPKAQEPTPKIISKEDVNALLFKPGKSFTDQRTYTVICLILSTGLRSRSVVNIKVDDLDFENRCIRVRETKNKKTIILPMTDKLYSVLTKYTGKWELGEYLFPHSDGTKMESESLQRTYKKYAQKRDVPYGLHALRHYYATEAVRNGVTPFALQRILGHSSIDITMKYVNLVNGDLESEMGKVNLI